MHDRVTLAAGDAVVEIAPQVGGSVAVFRWRGLDVLRPTTDDALANGDVRRFASYPLVPYSNRVANARLHTTDGRSYALARNMGDHPHAIHGVGWQRAWSLERASSFACTLSLAHRPDGEAALAWPFAFDAVQSFSLAATGREATLTMAMSIANPGPIGFPFGLGWHPFFPRDAATRLHFGTTSMWETNETMLPVHEARGASPFDPMRAIGEITLDNVFNGWTGRAVLEWPAHGLRAVIDADRAVDRLVVYIPPGRDYLAVEPVTHMTDAFNRSAHGEARTGTRELPPGASRSCTMRIVATLANSTTADP